MLLSVQPTEEVYPMPSIEHAARVIVKLGLSIKFNSNLLLTEQDRISLTFECGKLRSIAN